MGGPRARLDLYHLQHAGHLQGFGSVEAHHLAAVHRGPRHHRVDHPGQARVDAVLGLARHDVGAVHELQVALADVPELAGSLRRTVSRGGNGLGRRRLGERAVARAPARLGVYDLVILRLDLTREARPSAPPPPPRASSAPPRHSDAWARRSAACSASRRCPGCRSASRRPVACTTRTRFQSASSSSATIIGMPVRTPCPISDRWQTIVTMPSSPMATNTSGSSVQPLGIPSRPYLGGSAARVADGNPAARTRPPSAATPWRNRRRLTFAMTTGVSSLRGAHRTAPWAAACLIAARMRT